MKNIIKKIIKTTGYEIVSKKLLDKTSEQQQWLNTNFENLCLAYETQQNLKLPGNSKVRINLLKKLMGTPPSEAYLILKAISETDNIDGDVCEFGVAQGATSSLIANEVKENKSKVFHLFDSFEGLPAPTEEDKLKNDIFNLGNIENYTGQMSYPEAIVRQKLKEINIPDSQIKIHKGFIEKLLIEKKGFPKQVSFAYIDFDFYEPIKQTLEYLHTVTSNGAIIIVDDYDFFSTGVKKAVDEFVSKMNQTNPIYSLIVPNTEIGHFCIIQRNT